MPVSANEKWLEREVKRLERRISIKLLRASPRQYWLREVGAKERFSRLIRKIARAFWRGSINRGEFWDAMADAIRAGFDKAWEWGAREVGIAPGELTVDELQTLSALKAEWYPRISDLAQTIYEKRQSGAKLKDWYTTVLKPWDIAYVKVQNQAKLAARANPKLMWLWNPAKEHCFPAGTMVLTEQGEKPIETISVGERVWTPYGWQAVTKTYERAYDGLMIRIKAGGRTVTCTPNHPFLTDRGWREARQLSVFDMVTLSAGARRCGSGRYLVLGIMHQRQEDTIQVYNLQVDEHPMYVANGFVVHNCGDCTRLNTRVYRKSTWEKYDVYPQSPDLECTGKYCGCKFEVTDEPCTRGRPPAIAGQREKKGKK